MTLRNRTGGRVTAGRSRDRDGRADAESEQRPPIDPAV
jgi:hypothetical protein